MQQNVIPRERSESNKKFANDGSYESIEKMLYKIAGRCYARAQAMGLGMTFEDVHQEMNLSYVLAKEQWNPERGVLFSTYLTTACYRNFNERIRRAEVERRNLGLVNFTDMNVVSRDPDDDIDILEFADIEHDTQMQVVQLYGDNLIEGSTKEMEAPMSADPAALRQALQEASMARAKSMVALRNLTDNAKAVVADLLRAAQSRNEPSARLPRFSALLKERGFSDAEVRRIREEVIAAFGVRV